MANLSDETHSITVQTPHRLGVVLVAAGQGERLGAGIPKAFVPLGGVTLIERAIKTVLSINLPGHLVIVVPEGHAAAGLNMLEMATQTSGATWTTSVVTGGAERQHSVQNGLDTMPLSIDVVLVHDVARPLTPAQLFVEVAHAVRERNKGVIPVLPVTDTVKRLDTHGDVRETVNRSELGFAQTPQGFPLNILRASYEHVDEQFTDDASVVQAAGYAVTTIQGDARAHKLTTVNDAHLLEWMLQKEKANT